MTMAQIWPLVAAMVAVFGAMIGLVLRSMSAHRAELSAKIDGLRNEMNARLEPLTRQVDRIDQDVRDLSKAVLTGSPPQSS
jgi:hypothetical protein